jgi:uncharacterized coiled-coil protein SlyX
MPTNDEVELRERVAKLEATQAAQHSILVDLQKKVDQLWWKMGVVIGAVSAVGGNAGEIIKSLAG